MSRQLVTVSALAVLLYPQAGAAAEVAGVADAAEAAQAEVARQVGARLPDGWTARVRWRGDRLLVAFLTPRTIQEGFDVFYDARRQTELLAGLCPEADDPVWRLLGPGRDVAIEPEVMGKGGLRVSCRATLAEAPAS